MTISDAARLARDLWPRFEFVHDVAYFSGDVRDRLTDRGVRGFWTNYFAVRTAPLGDLDPAIVTSALFSFHRSRVVRSLPSVWGTVTPAQVLADRGLAAAAALIRFAPSEALLGEAADLLWTIALGADTSGRALAAANQSLTRPATPAATLWQAATTLREHRGDGHTAALVSHGLSPTQAHHLKLAATGSDGQSLQTSRGFSDEDWQCGADSLIADGLLDSSRRLTELGRQTQQSVEAATDRAAAQPWIDIGAEAANQAAALLDPIARSIARSDLIPRRHPAGLIWDATRTAEHPNAPHIRQETRA